MDCAGAKGWERIIQLLIEFEADIDPKDKAGVRKVAYDIYFEFLIFTCYIFLDNSITFGLQGRTFEMCSGFIGERSQGFK